MTPKQEAALRQAREALKKCDSALAEELAAWDIDPPLHHVLEASNACGPAIAAINEALAEQPAQQQEPVAWVERDGELVWNNREAAIGRNLYISSQPSKPWVGLTPEDHQAAWDAMSDYEDYDTYGAVLEAKLREKNA